MRLVQVAPVYVPPVLPAMRVRLSAGQVIPTDAYTSIEFDVENYDTVGDFNTGNHIWTCSQTGRYLCVVAIRMYSLPDACNMALRIWWYNGYSAPLIVYVTGNAGHFSLLASDILSLNVGDRGIAHCYQTSGGNCTIAGGEGAGTYWAMHRLS